MLSFITVTYNNLDGLKKTYDSILQCLNKKKCFDVEWIVVDGGSKDNTIDFLSGLKTDLFSIRWVSEKDNGIYDAMNKGVNLSRGDYVHFLNAGDKLLEDNIIDAVTLAKDRDVIFCSVRYNYNGRFYIRKPKDISYCNYGMPANHQGCIYKRKILLANPYPDKYLVSSDYWLNCICYKNKFSFSYYPTAVVDFEVGGVSTTKYLRVIKDMYLVQRDTLKLNILIAMLFGVRRFFVMSINYLLHKISLIFI